MMDLNVGNFDRLLRIALGLALIGFAVAGAVGPWGYAGALLVATGVGAFCPLYKLLNWRTCSR